MRLLVTTIVVSAVALLLLARLRFPAEQATPPVVPQAAPLERLAARATFDELAGIIAGVERTVTPSLVTVVLAPADPGDSLSPRWALGVRVDSRLAVAYLPPGARPERLIDGSGVRVSATDDLTALALLEVAAGPAGLPRTDDTVAAGYFAAAEASPRGPALFPVFVPRADPVPSARWGTELYSTALALRPGALLFTLRGEFAGVAVPRGNETALVPTRALFTRVEALQRAGSVRRARLDFTVQPLTRALAEATGATAGLVVTATGRQASALRVGDVITAVNSAPTPDLGTFQAVTASLNAKTPLKIAVLRNSGPVTVEVPPAASEAPPAAEGARPLGLTLRAERDVGVAVAAVAPGSAAAAAGLQAGDVLTHLDGAPIRRASEIERAWRGRSAALILGARRGTTPLVVALFPR